jgi:hypothetical protein
LAIRALQCAKALALLQGNFHARHKIPTKNSAVRNIFQNKD